MHEELRDAFLDLMSLSSTRIEPKETTRHHTTLTQEYLAGRRRYSQSFAYNAVDSQAFMGRLSRLDQMSAKVSDERLRALLDQHIGLLRRTAQHATSRDDKHHMSLQAKDVGLPTPSLIADAKNILEADQAPDDVVTHDLITAETLANAMRGALKCYGLLDWHVETQSSMAAKANVNGPLRRVRIKAPASLSPETARRLIAHEIGGHVLRWENALAQTEAIAAIPMGNTTLISEGLALWVEADLGLMQPSQLFTYALRVLAVDLAQERGIIDLIDALRTWTDVDTAVNLSLRVKRGLQDPNNNGGMTKDYCYLAGLQTVTNMSENRREAMQATQWSFEATALAVELVADGTLKPPTRMPCRSKLLEATGLSAG